jgi:hypothetical protein
MTEKKCIESVRHRLSSYQSRMQPCGKGAGHGPEGNYCKVHARKYATTEVVVYEVQPSYRKNLITKKTYREVTETSLFDKNGRRTNRCPEHHLTFESARTFLLKREADRVAAIERNLAEGRNRVSSAFKMEEADVPEEE